MLRHEADLSKPKAMCKTHSECSLSTSMNSDSLLNFLLAVPKNTALVAVSLYQKTSLFRQPSCRFYPSCSQYMADCVKQHGFLKGSILTVVRLAKCHPFHPGGVDKAPEVFPSLVPRLLISPKFQLFKAKR